MQVPAEQRPEARPCPEAGRAAGAPHCAATALLALRSLLAPGHPSWMATGRKGRQQGLPWEVCPGQIGGMWSLLDPRLSSGEMVALLYEDLAESWYQLGM